MIAEPYICLKGPKAGTIEWHEKDCAAFDSMACGFPDTLVVWKHYADFERAKLGELMADDSGITVTQRSSGFLLHLWPAAGSKTVTYDSYSLLGYSTVHYYKDSESSRLLKRAEFLHEVCKREGLAWLPNEPGSPNHGPCVICGKDVIGYCWWTRNPEKYPDAKPIHEGKCWQTWEGPDKPGRDYYTKGDSDLRGELDGLQTAMKTAKEKGIDVVKVLVEPEEGGIVPADCYTTEETDRLLQDCFAEDIYRERKKEREWRTAMLDFLAANFNTADNILNQPPLPTLDDLRRRFLA